MSLPTRKRLIVNVFVVIIMTLTIYVSLKLYISKASNQQNQQFQVSMDHIKFHSNWSEKEDHIRNIEDLHIALKLQTVSDVDISFALSPFQLDDIEWLLPFKLKPYKTLKLNFEQFNLGPKGGQYVLFLLQNGIQNLEICFDWIQADNNFGQLIGNKINQLSSLKRLQLSLISCGIKNRGFDSFFSIHQISQQLQELRLILIGNQLNKVAFKNFQTYIKNSSLKHFAINLYDNSLGNGGVKYLAAGLKHLQLAILHIDLYSNDIDEVGAKQLCLSISKIQTLQQLWLNFDQNDIKTNGIKSIGNMFKKLPKLSQLRLGVNQTNFDLQGLQHLMQGLNTQKQLTIFNFRCGGNQVTVDGIRLINDVFEGMNQLQTLSIQLPQNSIGDSGFEQITEAIVTKLPKLTNLVIDVTSNNIKGIGAINAFKILSQKSWNNIHLILSNNELRDPQIKLLFPNITQLLKNSNTFILQLIDTNISRVVMKQIQKLFRKNKNDKILVNSIISESEQQLAEKQNKKSNEQVPQVKEKSEQPPKVEKNTTTKKKAKKNRKTGTQKKKKQKNEAKTQQQQQSNYQQQQKENQKQSNEL